MFCFRIRLDSLFLEALAFFSIVDVSSFYIRIIYYVPGHRSDVTDCARRGRASRAEDSQYATTLTESNSPFPSPSPISSDFFSLPWTGQLPPAASIQLLHGHAGAAPNRRSPISADHRRSSPLPPPPAVARSPPPTVTPGEDPRRQMTTSRCGGCTRGERHASAEKRSTVAAISCDEVQSSFHHLPLGCAGKRPRRNRAGPATGLPRAAATASHAQGGAVSNLAQGWNLFVFHETGSPLRTLAWVLLLFFLPCLSFAFET